MTIIIPDCYTTRLPISFISIGVTIGSILWSIEAINYVSRGPSQLLLDAIVITNVTHIPVSGTDLWRLGIYGSPNEDGSGPRLGHQSQLLNSSQAAMPLNASPSIDLHFAVPLEFDVGQLGCTDYEYLCLEFAKGDNASPDFNFRSGSGKAVFTGCRLIPCDIAGKDMSKHQNLVWSSILIWISSKDKT